MLEQKDVIERLKTAWAGAHGGAIRQVEATEDERTFVVTTKGSFNRQKANFPAHGLNYLSHQADMFSEDEHVVIRIADALWTTLQASVPSEGAIDLTPEAALKRLARMAGTPADRLRDAEIIRQQMSDDLDHAITEALTKRQLQDQVHAAQEQLTLLQTELERLTAAPDTILIYETMSSSDMTAEKLRQKRREGYQIAFEGFVNKDGTPIYCARMERRTTRVPGVPPIRMIEVPIIHQPNSNGHMSAVVDPRRKSSSLFDRLQEQDNRELQPELDALMGVFNHE